MLYLPAFPQIGELFPLKPDLNPPGIADSDLKGFPGRTFDGLPLSQHQFFRFTAV